MLDTNWSRSGDISGVAKGLVKAGGLPTGEERARLVQEMFDRIAGSYELLNNLMSAGLHRIWNKRAVRQSGLRPGERALDLACGTGSLTRDLAKRVGGEGYVLGVDFSPEMLQRRSPYRTLSTGSGTRRTSKASKVVRSTLPL